MNAQLYYAVMLITNPQKARRILLAEELENWFMDLFDEEFEDILNGTFKNKQEVYMDMIVDKYLEVTGVQITDVDNYSKSVIDRAYKMATEIQETTWKNLVVYPFETKKILDEIVLGKNTLGQNTSKISDSKKKEMELATFILGGLAVTSVIFANDNIKRWLGQKRANLIALNESNWKWNNQEFFEAKASKKTKTWHIALDEKVRLTHMEMEGVTIPVDEPFHVGSSLMMMPLDMSLGADISEIANCRCTVSYK